MCDGPPCDGHCAGVLVHRLCCVLFVWQIKPLSQDKLARSLDNEFDEETTEEGGFNLGAGLQSLWDEMTVRMGTWNAGTGEKEESEVVEGAPPVHQGEGGSTDECFQCSERNCVGLPQTIDHSQHGLIKHKWTGLSYGLDS